MLGVTFEGSIVFFAIEKAVTRYGSAATALSLKSTSSARTVTHRLPELLPPLPLMPQPAERSCLVPLMAEVLASDRELAARGRADLVLRKAWLLLYDGICVIAVCGLSRPAPAQGPEAAAMMTPIVGRCSEDRGDNKLTQTDVEGC